LQNVSNKGCVQLRRRLLVPCRRCVHFSAGAGANERAPGEDDTVTLAGPLTYVHWSLTHDLDPWPLTPELWPVSRRREVVVLWQVTTWATIQRSVQWVERLHSAFEPIRVNDESTTRTASEETSTHVKHTTTNERSAGSLRFCRQTRSVLGLLYDTIRCDTVRSVKVTS